MHSCTHGSGTVVHLKLFFFFFLVFVVFKDKYITGLPKSRVFLGFFLLAVCDLSPYGFDSQGEKDPQLIQAASTSSTRALERWKDKYTSVYVLQAT